MKNLLIPAAVALTAGSAAADHTLGYMFNDASGPAAADGSASTGGSPFLNFNGSSMLGADGSGVSGLAGDRAFDNSSASTMGGVTSAGGRGQHSADFEPIDTLTSFTLQGWFRTDGSTSIGNNATLFDNSNSATSGFNLRGTGATAGALTLSVNNGSVISSTSYGATQEWVYFAVTYDGTAVQPGPNVFFYQGSTSSSVTQVSSGTLIAGAVNNDASVFGIGGENPFGSLNTFAFDGFLDNMRIWDEVLDASALESVRVGDAVPAPGAALTLAAGGLFASRRRRTA